MSEAAGKMQTADLRTSKWLGLVLGFLLRVRVRERVSIMVKIKVRVSSSILPYCRSAGPVRSPHLTRGRSTALYWRR